MEILIDGDRALCYQISSKASCKLITLHAVLYAGLSNSLGNSA